MSRREAFSSRSSLISSVGEDSVDKDADQERDHEPEPAETWELGRVAAIAHTVTFARAAARSTSFVMST